MICYKKTQLKNIGSNYKKWKIDMGSLKLTRQNSVLSPYFYLSSIIILLVFESFI
jgi:hypothetical protein